MSAQVLQHPQTGEVRSVGNDYLAPLWCGLFTPLYFLFKRNWRHALLSWFLGIMSLGLSSFVYLFMVFRLNEDHLRLLGYVDDESRTADSHEAKRKIGFGIGFLMRLPFGIFALFALFSNPVVLRAGIIVGVLCLVVWLISSAVNTRA